MRIMSLHSIEPVELFLNRSSLHRIDASLAVLAPGSEQYETTLLRFPLLSGCVSIEHDNEVNPRPDFLEDYTARFFVARCAAGATLRVDHILDAQGRAVQSPTIVFPAASGMAIDVHPAIDGFDGFQADLAEDESRLFGLVAAGRIPVAPTNSDEADAFIGVCLAVLENHSRT